MRTPHAKKPVIVRPPPPPGRHVAFAITLVEPGDDLTRALNASMPENGQSFVLISSVISPGVHVVQNQVMPGNIYALTLQTNQKYGQVVSTSESKVGNGNPHHFWVQMLVIALGIPQSLSIQGKLGTLSIPVGAYPVILDQNGNPSSEPVAITHFGMSPDNTTFNISFTGYGSMYTTWVRFFLQMTPGFG